MSERWFRFYDGVPDDPKILKLSERQYRAWSLLLCVANRYDGEVPKDLVDAALILRTPIPKAKAVMNELVAAILFDETETGYAPHNWNGRQYKSDVSTDRVKLFRERQKKHGGNVSSGVSGTPPEDRVQKPETEKKESSVPNGTAATAARGDVSTGKPEWWPKRDRYGRVTSEITDKLLFDLGKSVLGTNAGGQITKLKKCYRGDLRACADILLQADEKSDVREWFAGVLRRAQLDEPTVPQHEKYPDEIYRDDGRARAPPQLDLV